MAHLQRANLTMCDNIPERDADCEETWARMIKNRILFAGNRRIGVFGIRPGRPADYSPGRGFASPGAETTAWRALEGRRSDRRRNHSVGLPGLYNSFGSRNP